ncbi:AfsR/SARP family transcriptional regulator [Pseudonocardia sp. HH130630-07]|uniref:AfsR/SARP family transcriptional regulator n=1 Tax=Pseudonocardia sp. HH130630-07 TaxID=1690815 RepID=UPI0018D2BC43|nr:BTAD domain-containing putative transcriptional regulator [Pseudonocardia sp. HH130630-07]
MSDRDESPKSSKPFIASDGRAPSEKSLSLNAASKELDIRILNTTEVEYAGRIGTPEAPKYRQVLALLAFRVGTTVSIESMIDELWPSNPPRTAVTTTQTYIYGLRKIVDKLADKPLGKQVIATRRPGYILCLERESIDIHRFRDKLGTARSLAAQDAQQALREYDQILSCTPTVPLSDIALGPVLISYADEIREVILSARHERIELALKAGDPNMMLPELRLLTATFPLRENFARSLMQALAATNRRAEALQVFHEVRTVLNRDLGIEPCHELRALQEKVLRGNSR